MTYSVLQRMPVCAYQQVRMSACQLVLVDKSAGSESVGWNGMQRRTHVYTGLTNRKVCQQYELRLTVQILAVLVEQVLQGKVGRALFRSQRCDNLPKAGRLDCLDSQASQHHS